MIDIVSCFKNCAIIIEMNNIIFHHICACCWYTKEIKGAQNSALAGATSEGGLNLNGLGSFFQEIKSLKKMPLIDFQIHEFVVPLLII